ncbi:BamA/TamA family outer membrane protein [Myxococcus sp. K15C18031901]|uniref:BamA/TamA family outer membrane protein n=1 Tax=Myxococcus dinghuensis TaxID=2906761 RepID=UPI0020A79EBF|nr:BamA/TamA family outer membrane protein [Myxococcus dinghuensis]MCP3098250.1 BamA/TamA family outer membrane protein [Myxococcus dinghuensis]
MPPTNSSLSQVRLLVVLQAVGLPCGALAQEGREAQAGGHPDGLRLEATAPEPRPLTGRIERIELRGNTRTRDSVILRALRLGPGDVLATGDVPELKRRLLNLKLFKSVEVLTLPERSGVGLQVDVEERWTLLPIPVFSSGKGQWQAGIFALESNLFGLNKTLVAGGMAGNRGGSLFSMFRDPSIGGTRWTGLLSFQFAKTDRERRNEDVVVDTYTDRRFDIAGTLGYQVTPELNLGVGAFALVNKPLATEGGSLAPSRGEVYGVSLSAEYLGQDFHFYFDEGLVVRALLRQGLDFLGSTREMRQVTLLASYTLPVFGTHALTLTAQHNQSWGDAFLDAQLLGGRTGSRGFATGTLWAETASLATLEYQVPLWSPRMMTLTAHAFVDVGRVEWRNTVLRYVSPGIGVRAYVREVAIPAVGFEVTRDPQTGDVVTSVAVGFGL